MAGQFGMHIAKRDHNCRASRRRHGQWWIMLDNTQARLYHSNPGIQTASDDIAPAASGVHLPSTQNSGNTPCDVPTHPVL